MDIFSRFKPEVKGFPSETNPDKKKSNDFYLQWGEAMYSAYLRNQTGITAEDGNMIKDNRLFGNGKQSEDLYKDILLGKRDREGTSSATMQEIQSVDGGENSWVSSENRLEKYKGFMNILWDIVSPANKLTETLKGKMARERYNIVVQTVDQQSRDKVEYRKFDALRYSKNKVFEDGFMMRAGIKPPERQFLPESKEQMDMFDELGAFKLPYAVYMEQFCGLTERFSGSEELEDNQTDDILNTNIVAEMVERDSETGLIRRRYVDPARAIIEYSRHSDHRDSEYGGEFIDESIGELVSRGVIKRDQAADIAKEYAGYMGNPALEQFDYYNQESSIGSGYDYDFFKVCVLDFWFIDMDEKWSILKLNNYGNHKVIDVEVGTPIKETSKKKKRVVHLRKLYRGKWIVGSKVTYECGVSEDMIRKNKSIVRAPMNVYRKKGRPITEQIKPFYNNIQLIWLKYQDAIATARKSGYSINYNAIANLVKGGQTNAEQYTIKRLLQTGVIFYKPTNSEGVFNTQSKAVEELKGGVGDLLSEFIASFRFNMEMIEDITGINPITLGKAPEPRTPVKGSEMAKEGTDNLISSIMKGRNVVKQRSYDYAVEWVRLLLNNNKISREAYIQTLGKTGVSALRAADRDHVKYGCFLVLGVSDFERKEMLESAKISLQNGRDGKPGISEADYALILNMLNNPTTSPRLIHLELDRRIKAAQARAQSIAERNIKLQKEAETARDQAIFENKAREMDLERQKEIDVANNEGNQKRKTLTHEYNLKEKHGEFDNNSRPFGE